MHFASLDSLHLALIYKIVNPRIYHSAGQIERRTLTLNCERFSGCDIRPGYCYASFCRLTARTINLDALALCGSHQAGKLGSRDIVELLSSALSQ